MKMKLKNIKLFDSTNSSSAHSFVFVSNPENIRDDDCEDYGWNYFTAASTPEKERYIFSTLYENLSYSFGDVLSKLIMNGLGYSTDDEDSIAGIDHQSVLTIPTSVETGEIDIDFFNDLKNYILRENVVILGGNDNCEDVHWLAENNKSVLEDIPREYCPGTLISRKDGDYWVLFDKNSGSRITFSFEDDPKESTKPEYPYLVDIKITDFCDLGCAYCYQGSTKNGLKCDNSFFYDIKNVFEIVLGGGEVTRDREHFISVLNVIRYRAGEHVNINFTTRTLDWLNDEKYAQEILSKTKTFAFSVDEKNQNQLEKLINIFDYRWNVENNELYKNKPSIQIIPEIMGDYCLEKILRICKNNFIKVVLLGYKETGRGIDYKKVKYNTIDDRFLRVLDKLVKDQMCPNISVDTAMISKYHDTISNILPSWLYHKEEGKYSMYIDLVTKQFAPSSYHLDMLKPIEHKSFEEIFSEVEIA